MRKDSFPATGLFPSHSLQTQTHQLPKKSQPRNEGNTRKPGWGPGQGERGRWSWSPAWPQIPKPRTCQGPGVDKLLNLVHSCLLTCREGCHLSSQQILTGWQRCARWGRHREEASGNLWPSMGGSLIRGQAPSPETNTSLNVTPDAPHVPRPGPGAKCRGPLVSTPTAVRLSGSLRAEGKKTCPHFMTPIPWPQQ